LTTWLAKLYIRSASANTIKPRFGLGLMFDTRAPEKTCFGKADPYSARKFFLADKNCPLAYEPSGEDFSSPCLGEAT